MKKFLIIGNLNAISYKEIFPMIKDNKVWLGASNLNTGMYFYVNDDFVYADSYKFEREIDGKKVSRLGNVCWYTNLEHNKRPKPLELTQTYSPDKYPKYDNYDAIEVSRTKDIPKDYYGVMGVPISFLNKWCPEQFKIVDARDYDLNNKCDEQSARPFIEGNEIYRRVLNQHSKPQSPNETFTYVNGEKKYARVFNKHSHPNKLRKDESNIIL